MHRKRYRNIKQLANYKINHFESQGELAGYLTIFFHMMLGMIKLALNSMDFPLKYNYAFF